VTELRSRLDATLGETYRIERELGGGGMSRVFVADETALARKVVIKVLPPEMAAGVNEDRFRREIHLAARLQHPHIVPLLSAGSADDMLYYVMPYVGGESLRGKLSRDGALPVSEAVRIFRDVIDALACAHDEGIVHRDIKPDNVLLSRGHAVVTDFGVAKAIAGGDSGHADERARSRASLTSLGLALGTPAYMAPEQASADPHVDHRADIYAVGVLAYEMLVGRPPFLGPTPQATLMAHMTQSPERPSTYRPTIPAALENVIMRCLEKHAADRWQSASELLPYLDALSTPTTGLPPTTAATPQISSGTEAALRRAHPVRVAGLFAGGALAVLGISWLLVQELGLPSWVLPAAVALLLVGLPIMMITARRERERMIARSTGAHPVDPGGLAGRLFTWRGSLAGGALALGSLALGTGAFMALRAAGVGPFATLVSAGVLRERDPLVLADFANRTTDSTLGTSITEAIRIDLTRSPVVRLLEPNTVVTTLRLMQRDPSLGLDEAAAREVAQREGAKAVVAGEVAPLGSGYVLSVRLVSATDSTTLVAERETASDAAGIIAAVERLSQKLRERIGESLRTIRGGEPLERVTTQSLPALRAYSEGSRAFIQGFMNDALQRLSEAVALDSNFGMAWRRIGVALSNTQADRARMIDALEHAYRLQDRMPPLEAAHAVAFYHSAVTRDRSRATEAYERLVARWPDDGTALNNLANQYLRESRFGEAEPVIRRAVATQPTNVIYNRNLLDVLIGQKRFTEAESAYAEMSRRLPANAARVRFGSALAREQGQFDRALVLSDSSTGPLGRGVEFPGYVIHAELFRLLGRFREAQRIDTRAMEWIERRSVSLWWTQGLNEAIDLGSVFDRPDAAVRRIDALLQRHALDSMPPASRPYGQIIVALVRAGRLDRAQALASEYERVVPREIRDTDGNFYLGKAHLLLARGDAKGAIDAFRRARDLLGCRECTAFDEARAFERMSQPDSAILKYEQVTNSGDIDSDTRHFTMVAALRRLGELYESRGDRAKAVDYYGRFVDLWKNADPELQPLVADVRRHMANLAGEPKR
jgi:eukaryotic-like serine/threonine-protein kinase